MDKSERKKLGAWISLLGGACFVIAALAAVYVAFFMPAEYSGTFLVRLARLFHK